MRYSGKRDSPNNGVYVWTIPNDLSSWYQGKQQIKIAVQFRSDLESTRVGAEGISEIFEIVGVSDLPSLRQPFKLLKGQGTALRDAPLRITFVDVGPTACTDSVPPHCNEGAIVRVELLAHPDAKPDTFTLVRGEKRENVFGYTIHLSELTHNIAQLFVSKSNPASPISVISPDGFERWQKGEVKSIRWSAPRSVREVSIDVATWIPPCTDPGALCPQRAATLYHLSTTPNDGAFDWGVGKAERGEIPPGQYIITVSDRAGNTDASDGPFTIVDDKQGSPNLSFALFKSKDTYMSGERIDFKIIATNESKETTTLHFGGSCQATYQITSESGGSGEAVAQQCSQGPTFVTILGGQKHSWGFTHEPTKLTAGVYLLTGYVNGYGSASAKIVITDSDLDKKFTPNVPFFLKREQNASGFVNGLRVQVRYAGNVPCLLRFLGPCPISVEVTVSKQDPETFTMNTGDTVAVAGAKLKLRAIGDNSDVAEFIVQQ